MTTYVEARDAIVGLVNGAWPAEYPDDPVFYENALRVDLDEVAGSFLRVEIEFDDARQSTVGVAPQHRVYGAAHFTVFTKDGAGVRHVLERLQFLTDVAKFQSISGVRMQAPRPGPRGYKDGWRSYELRVPFWFDSGA